MCGGAQSLSTASTRQLHGSPANKHSFAMWVDTTQDHMPRNDYLVLLISVPQRLFFDISLSPPESSVELMPFESEFLLSSFELPHMDNFLFSIVQNAYKNTVYLEGQKGCASTEAQHLHSTCVSLCPWSDGTIHSILSAEQSNYVWSNLRSSNTHCSIYRIAMERDIAGGQMGLTFASWKYLSIFLLKNIYFRYLFNQFQVQVLVRAVSLPP